jgi:hypothetical protein
MALTQWKSFGKNLQMELFATGVTGNLRVVLTYLSVQGNAGPTESFFLGFFEENIPASLAYASHINIPAALARSVVKGTQVPATPDENEQTLDAVINDGTTLDRIRTMATTHPLLLNLTSQVSATKAKVELDQSTPRAKTTCKIKSWDKSGGAI